MEEDEYLDLVDENDSVIGRKLRSEVHAEKLRNYRAINLFIVNSKGELWIPKRTAHKRLYPLGLDFSCAGHVQSGDTYEQTLKKEVREELNIDIDKTQVRYLGKLTPVEGSCFAENYEIRMDTAPAYNSDDFINYEWVAPAVLIKRLDAGEYAKSSLVKAVRKFYKSAA
ncbi:NUDIX hydrolase [Candidatus Kaiserbacteria bacterium RIFCSPHIGHO2_02_FULL_55_25]|uniref:NUDIX hydrolase n=1 Tax=Candidatus Kaiserbacteria bacterium RIFCSPHIGHO2_02_FULL_55_25 TaxID=1798498 RepID=A0A1F6E6M4_9BACT|nr:MAG: NUDIX hydrolase [Candidatus Kaiserbacteria bacterium RIFCSPHIGHO2_01_FULL_55_79]OGG69349.1 MAG: NUDIX hydrolase [Candidatus Kaiserbacteria bacterium RIFCSPHIGHO2_02_FULL_55_25]OGG83373.1 MAG: NUDIX hydrolase [Candidatus Kaiserbacteria bacterium RIFCSPLOWO2_01_FULL_55_25]